MTEHHYNFILEYLLTKIATSFQWNLHQAIGKVKLLFVIMFMVTYTELATYIQFREFLKNALTVTLQKNTQKL